MKSKQENLIWRYLDQEASSEERSEVERLLLVDEVFKEQFLGCQVLQQKLEEMETEAPSMRFVQNVMDRLPPVRSLATTPLISVKWLRTFFGGILAILSIALGSSILLPTPDNLEVSAKDRLVSLLNPLLEIIPANMLMMAGIISTGLLLLLLLDRWLQARFMRS